MVGYTLAIGCGIALLAIIIAGMFAALRPLWRERRRELSNLAALLAALAIIKCLLLPLFSGYPQDIFQFLLWGEVMARGPWHVYDPQFVCRYTPAYLYAWWAAVASARDLYLGPEITDATVSALRTMVRVPALVADLLLALVILAWMRAIDGGWRARRAIGAVILFALNPALLYTSVVWGQNDSALTLPVMLALLMMWQGNYALAAAVAALAVMVKLQGLIVLPVLGIWMLLHGRVRDWLVAALAFIGTGIITIAPFQVARPWDFLATMIESSADYFPYTSLNAFNLMALAVGLRVRDSTTLLGVSAFSVGMFLLGALLLVAIFLMWRVRTPRMLLYAAFLAYLGFFMLPTRIHERYLYFALALLTPFALDSWATITMYAVLTVTFLINQFVTLRFLNHFWTAARHDQYATPIACINLAALAIAIAYGMFLISSDRTRWPRPLRAFFDPFAT